MKELTKMIQTQKIEELINLVDTTIQIKEHII